MRKVGLIFLVVFLMVMLLSTELLATGESVTLENLKVACVVTESADARISVTADLKIEGNLTTLSLPLDAGATDWEIAGYSAKKIEEDGFVFLEITEEAGFTGSRTFSWSYTIPGTVVQKDDGQTFSLSVIPARWSWGAQACQFTVEMPKAFSGTPEFFSGYYGDVVEGNLEIETQDNTISGTYTEPLMDHESLTLQLEVPAEYFKLSSDGWSDLVFQLLLVALLVATVAYWWATLRNKRITVAARTLPPDGAAGELPYFYTCDNPDFGLMTMFWASLGYLNIFVNGRGQTILRQNMPMGNERRAYESKLLHSLFGQEMVCNGGGRRFGRTAQRAEAAMERFWRKRLFFPNSGNPFILRLFSGVAGALVGVEIAGGLLTGGVARWILAAGLAVAGFYAGVEIPQILKNVCYKRYRQAATCLGMFLGMLILGVLAGKSSSIFLVMLLFATVAVTTLYGGRRSQLGQDVLAQVRGFRRFLLHVSDHHLVLTLRRDPQYFYKLLPYAQSVGLGKVFAEKFGQRELEPCEYFQVEGKPASTAIEFYDQFRQALEQMEQARKHFGS